MAQVSVDKRTGNFVVRVYGGKDAVTGRVMRPSTTLPSDASEADIERAAEELELKAGLGKRAGHRYTVGGLLEHYLDTRLLYGMSPTSLESYRSNARCYVYPYIGSIPYDRVRPADFANLYSELLAHGGQGGKGISQRTVKKLHSMLSGCFTTLMRDGIVDANVVSGIKVPRGESPEAQPLSEADFRKFVEFLAGRLAAPVGGDTSIDRALWLDLHTGLRRGELAALRISSYKPVSRAVRVTESLAQVSGVKHLVYKPPKSRSSVRTVALDRDTDDLIDRHVEEQARYLAKLGTAQTRETPLFARPDGGPIPPSDYTSRFRRIADELGIPKAVKLKSLRHTHATYLLEGGENMRTIMERLGHSAITVTLGTYSHVMPGRDESAADRFAALSSVATDGQRDAGQ